MTLQTDEGEKLRQEIITLARGGMTPRLIHERYRDRCEKPYVMNVISQARRDGVRIPRFRRGRNLQTAKNSTQLIDADADSTLAQIETVAPVKPADLPKPGHALDFFELRALKKMFGADLKEIEAAADVAGLSIANYVRKCALALARGIRV